MRQRTLEQAFGHDGGDGGDPHLGENRDACWMSDDLVSATFSSCAPVTLTPVCDRLRHHDVGALHGDGVCPNHGSLRRDAGYGPPLPRYPGSTQSFP